MKQSVIFVSMQVAGKVKNMENSLFELKVKWSPEKGTEVDCTIKNMTGHRVCEVMQEMNDRVSEQLIRHIFNNEIKESK